MSDHLPLFMKLSTGNTKSNFQSQQSSPNSYAKINWEKLSPDDLIAYKQSCVKYLNEIPFNHELILCDNTSCKNKAHTIAIDKLYDDIVNCLHAASAQLSSSKRRSSAHTEIAGWNDVCRDLHSEAREAFLLWRHNSSPRQGPLHQLMRSTRAQFKLALRQCRKEKSLHEANSLANDLLRTPSKEFWKKVKSINTHGLHASYPECIEGNKGETAIAEMWKDHYKSLLNSSTLTAGTIDYENLFNANLERLSANEIQSATKLLNIGKSAGHDHIEAEHIKYGDNKLYPYLSILFNCVIVQNYLPSSCLGTVSKPLLKSKRKVGKLMNPQNSAKKK